MEIDLAVAAKLSLKVSMKKALQPIQQDALRGGKIRPGFLDFLGELFGLGILALVVISDSSIYQSHLRLVSRSAA